MWLVDLGAALLETGMSTVVNFSNHFKALRRMEAALAEMALDTTEKEVDDDVDFVNGKGSFRPQKMVIFEHAQQRGRDR